MKNKKLAFQAKEEIEERDQLKFSDDEEDVKLTDYEKQQFHEMKKEFYEETGDGSVLQIRTVAPDGATSEVTMEEARKTSGFDQLDTVEFGDTGIRKVTTPFDPERSERIKNEIANERKKAMVEILEVKKTSDDVDVDDFNLAIDHYFELVREKGKKSIEDFNSYVDQSTERVLMEEVPKVIFDVVTDSHRLKFNPRPECRAVKEFLKANYGMIYSNYELDKHVENHQQLMDLAVFSQEAGMDIHDFLTSEKRFDELKSDIKKNLKMQEDEELSFKKDIFKKLVTHSAMKRAYENLLNVCDAMDRMIDIMNPAELYAYIDECANNIVMIKEEQLAKWDKYDYYHGKKINHIDPLDNIEKLKDNENYDEEAYDAAWKCHQEETNKRLNDLYDIFRPIFKLALTDDIYRIVTTLKTDQSIGLMRYEDFDKDAAKKSIEIKRFQMNREIAFCQSFIEFLPKVTDLAIVRAAFNKLANKKVFIAKTRKPDQLQERAITCLKELKKLPMKIAIAGYADEKSVKANFVSVKDRLTTVYTETSRFFMLDVDETRSIPEMDMSVFTSTYIIFVHSIFEVMSEPLVKKDAESPLSKIDMQYELRLLEAQLVEITSFFSFAQMVDKDSIYEIIVTISRFIDLFEFKSRDIKILKVSPFQPEADIEE